MARNAQKQARRETLEHELQEVRSTIRALREAPEPAQPEHGVLFELERAEEREVRLLEALAALDADLD
jgi:hypothetical protein